MPKNSTGITKAIRMLALQQVLQRHGRLDKRQIDELLSAKLDTRITEALSRSIYRDLEELERNGEVDVIRLTRDGLPIPEYDPETHRNTTAHWQITGSEDRIRGELGLRSLGGEFLCSERLRLQLRIDVGKIGHEFKALHLYFNLKDQFCCLKIDAEAAPVTLLVARRSKGESYSIMSLESTEGKRMSALFVPVGGVSARAGGRLGHFRLKILGEKQVEITDLGSTNGTQVTKLTSAEADKLIAAGNLLGSETVTTTWSRAEAGNANPITCSEGKEMSCTMPILIQASEGFRVLLT